MGSMVLEVSREYQDKVTQMVEAGAVRPVVAKVFPFTVAGLEGAYRHVMTGRTKGKVVIHMTQPADDAAGDPAAHSADNPVAEAGQA